MQIPCDRIMSRAHDNRLCGRSVLKPEGFDAFLSDGMTRRITLAHEFALTDIGAAANAVSSPPSMLGVLVAKFEHDVVGNMLPCRVLRPVRFRNANEIALPLS